MKVDLAAQYRIKMFALLPATLGIGTAALWARSLRWPHSLDAAGMTFRDRRKLSWASIEKIAVRRDYLDGRVSRIDIHHHGDIARIPVDALRNGDVIARVILAAFKLARRHGSRAVVDHWRTIDRPHPDANADEHEEVA